MTCLRCQKDIPPGLSSCVWCGGPPLYRSLGEPWGVMAGPVAASRHRKEMRGFLQKLLSDYSEARAERKLAAGKVWVVGDLRREVAEALVARLSPQKTLAEVLEGKPGWRLPGLGSLLAVGGAAGLSLLAESLILTAGAVGAGAVGSLVREGFARRPLGKARELPEEHRVLGKLGEEAVALAQKLPKDMKSVFCRMLIAVGGMLACSPQREPSWLLGEYGEGLEGAAVAFLREGVRLVRNLLQTPEGSPAFMERAREMVTWYEKLRATVDLTDRKQAEETAQALRREMEILRETLDEMEKL